MAFSYGFFNSKGLDRTYTAENFCDYLGSIICNGIQDTYGQKFHLRAGSGLSVILGTGKAWIDGHYFINDAAYSIDLSSYQNESLPRIIAISIVLNTAESARNISVEITAGTPAESPTLPTFTQDADKKRLILYGVRLNAGATELTSSNISDYRDNENKCGYCRCILGKCEVTDIHTLNEGLDNISGSAHTHENKSVLDSFTQADKTAIDSLPLFKQGINDDISELRESVSTVVEQAHWHHNLTVLNGITSAKIAKWDSATEWQLQFQTLQGNVMDYQMQMNHRMDEADETISAVDTAVQQLRDSNQYDHQNLSDEINLLTNRVTNLESELEEIDSILSRIVG